MTLIRNQKARAYSGIYTQITDHRSQNISISSDGSQPDPPAALHVKATNKGVLVPGVDLANLPASPSTGFLVYVTDTGPVGNNAFYYFDGSEYL